MISPQPNAKARPQSAAQPSFLRRLSQGAARVGLDGFVLALLATLGLAYWWPTPGIDRGSWSLSSLAGYGVSFIFFFYGLRLSPEKLRAGLRNWQLHTVIQLATFVLFPLAILLARAVFHQPGNNGFWLGIFYLATLPSTVSSSVVMVSIAKGNLPAAIFNASISSLIGVFLTPVWMGWFLQAGSIPFAFGEVIAKLSLQVLVPVVAGISLHRYWGSFAEQHRQGLRYFDQFIILLIVYTSFCESFAGHLFESFRAADLVELGAYMIGLFLGVYGFISAISHWLGFSREDRITAVFCGSKKSLVHGTVMSKVLFAGSSTVGVILLPLMLYHALQLMAASILAQSLARRKETQP